MSKELENYRIEMEYIIERLGNKGFYSTTEIAALDYDGDYLRDNRQTALRATRKRYGITERGLPMAALARKRARLGGN